MILSRLVATPWLVSCKLLLVTDNKRSTDYFLFFSGEDAGD